MGMVAQPVNIWKNSEFYTLKWWILWHVNYISIEKAKEQGDCVSQNQWKKSFQKNENTAWQLKKLRQKKRLVTMICYGCYFNSFCMVFGLVFFTVKLAKPAYEYSSSNSIISLTLAKTCSIFFLPESCEPLTYQMGHIYSYRAQKLLYRMKGREIYRTLMKTAHFYFFKWNLRTSRVSK